MTSSATVPRLRRLRAKRGQLGPATHPPRVAASRPPRLAGAAITRHTRRPSCRDRATQASRDLGSTGSPRERRWVKGGWVRAAARRRQPRPGCCVPHKSGGNAALGGGGGEEGGDSRGNVSALAAGWVEFVSRRRHPSPTQRAPPPRPSGSLVAAPSFSGRSGPPANPSSRPGAGPFAHLRRGGVGCQARGEGGGSTRCHYRRVPPVPPRSVGGRARAPMRTRTRPPYPPHRPPPIDEVVLLPPTLSPPHLPTQAHPPPSCMPRVTARRWRIAVPATNTCAAADGGGGDRSHTAPNPPVCYRRLGASAALPCPRPAVTVGREWVGRRPRDGSRKQPVCPAGRPPGPGGGQEASRCGPPPPVCHYTTPHPAVADGTGGGDRGGPADGHGGGGRKARGWIAQWPLPLESGARRRPGGVGRAPGGGVWWGSVVALRWRRREGGRRRAHRARGRGWCFIGADVTRQGRVVVADTPRRRFFQAVAASVAAHSDPPFLLSCLSSLPPPPFVRTACPAARTPRCATSADDAPDPSILVRLPAPPARLARRHEYSRPRSAVGI